MRGLATLGGRRGGLFSLFLLPFFPQVHAKKVLLSSDVDLEVVARGTTGFSGLSISL